jgi:hypothetical protein
MRKAVASVSQSPMNALRWLITLECGHELWVTRKRRPSSSPRLMVCAVCTKDAQAKEKR